VLHGLIELCIIVSALTGVGVLDEVARLHAKSHANRLSRPTPLLVLGRVDGARFAAAAAMAGVGGAVAGAVAMARAVVVAAVGAAGEAIMMISSLSVSAP
jgi:hypothetical protein